MATKTNLERALDSIKRIGGFSENEKEGLVKALRTTMFPGIWSTDSPDDGDTLVYDLATDTWNFQPAGIGDLKADGTTPLTANWDVGAFDLTVEQLTATVMLNTTDVRLTFANAAVGTYGQPNSTAYFYAGNTINSGAAIRVYGESHATWPRNIEFLSGSVPRLTWEDPDSLWNFESTNITTTGKYISKANGHIYLEPHGIGNVFLGNFRFDVDQTVGAGQDNYVLTYDDGTGAISLEASASGFSDPMTTRGDLIYKDSGGTTVRLPAGTANYVLTSDGTDIAWAASVAGVSVFTGLTDTPSTFVGQANKWLRVNAGETAIEFASVTPVTAVTASSPVLSSAGTTPNITIQEATAAQHGYMSLTYAGKLDSIESNADVTDAANVAAAGAFMGNVTISASAPSGGSDGDLWFQVA